MGKLTDSIKEKIADIRPGIIATASKDGRPNVSAKGSLRVLDDDHLIFADISSPRTIANLKENSEVSILVLHPKSMRGCRIWGKGEVLSSGDIFDQMTAEFAERDLKVNHVVKITVEEAQDNF
ncbi:MAG: pyridoxamine 5'-phosphate oxidase family protein [Dehalococcoidia bacterium]|nr:MAG: pyridoxamine 5'-phosphate oxidase family protein [Dehalococcoidia bacterium]UCG83839.1 MAG: pyridoxamine 5'-phosphate oxidase family protein [Dehalococcoidia bacterium]